MLLVAYAQNAQPAGAQQMGDPLMGLLPIALIFVIFYFLLIRPQKRAQKEHKDMLERIARNDEVVTSGGIFGTVVNIQDDVVTLRIAKDTKIKIRKSAISNVLKGREGAHTGNDA